MNLMISLMVGVLFGSSVYLMLKKNRFETLLGFAMLSNAVNLAILSGTGWLASTKPPVLDNDYVKVATEAGETYVSTVSPEQYVDPIPQALILTAIVIGFALISFLMVLISEYSLKEQEESST